MTTESISQLPGASAASWGDLSPVTVGSTGPGTGITKNETWQQVEQLFASALPLATGSAVTTTAAATLALPTLPNAVSALRYTGTLKCQNPATGDAASWDIAAQISRRTVNASATWVGATQQVIPFAADSPLTALAPAFALQSNGGALVLPFLAGVTLNWSLELRFS